MAPRKAKGKGKVAPTVALDGKKSEKPKRLGNPAWQPGVSGNPGGMPKGVGEVKKLAREWTKQAIETLAEIMMDEKQTGSARVSAAETILSRGYGKPLQQMEVGKPGDFAEMTDDQVDAFIAQTVNELSAAKTKPDQDNRVIN